MKRAPLPYHFCSAPRCTHMTPPGVFYCPTHALRPLEEDEFFPGAETLSPDASQEVNPQPQPVSGDAGISTEEYSQ